MSVNSVIIKALSSFGYPIEPDTYTGKEKKYITFNYAADQGANYGDNEPACTIAYMQVHFFMPLLENGAQVNYLKIKRQIREALFHAGFTYPEVTVLIEQENNIRHIVYECQIREERED